MDPITKYLLQNGADLNLKDNTGKTPLDMAFRTPIYQQELKGINYLYVIITNYLFIYIAYDLDLKAKKQQRNCVVRVHAAAACFQSVGNGPAR